MQPLGEQEGYINHERKNYNFFLPEFSHCRSESQGRFKTGVVGRWCAIDPLTIRSQRHLRRRLRRFESLKSADAA